MRARERVKSFDWQCENCQYRDDPSICGKPTICPKCGWNKWMEVEPLNLGADPSLDTDHSNLPPKQMTARNGVVVPALETLSATPEADAARIGEIRKRVEKATKGPWKYIYDQEGSSMGWICEPLEGHPGYFSNDLFKVSGDSGQQECNAEFAAHAREDIPYLLAEVERREKQWRSWGVVEVAVRNQSVADYCKHWEERTEKAETELANAQREIYCCDDVRLDQGLTIAISDLQRTREVAESSLAAALQERDAAASKFADVWGKP